ncbi:hypothetical protein pb186bvf_016541 [Paramecium bursaria]
MSSAQIYYYIIQNLSDHIYNLKQITKKLNIIIILLNILYLQSQLIPFTISKNTIFGKIIVNQIITTINIIRIWNTLIINIEMKQIVQRQKLFLVKLKQILQVKINLDQNNQLNYCIRWNQDGDKIILENKNQFILDILPKYYKHNNYNSFLRQLNKYKFKTQKNQDQKMELYHQYFQRDNIQINMFQLSKGEEGANYQQKQLNIIRKQIFQLILNQQHLIQQMEKIQKQMNIFYRLMTLIISMYLKNRIGGWRNANSLLRFHLLFCRGISNEFFKQQMLYRFDQALEASQLVVQLYNPKCRKFLKKLNNWETEVFSLFYDQNLSPVYQIYRMSPINVFYPNEQMKMLGYLSEDEQYEYI